MTPEQKNELLDAIDRVEFFPEQIFVRQNDGTNVALSELPTVVALQYVCKWFRRHMESR